jgi:hypothetical protein
MALIQRWKHPEPTLQCLFFRLLIPYAGLFDALIGILSFSLFCSGFEMWATCRHTELYFNHKIKQQEKLK